MKYKQILRRRRLARAKKQNSLHWSIALGILVALLIAVIVGSFKSKKTFELKLLVKAEAPETKVITKFIEKEKVIYIGSELDRYVDQYAKKYSYGSLDKYSELKASVQCLFYFESKHTNSMGFGDNGKAGGPLQFWEGTYNGFRKIMIENGLTDHIGSRMDLEDSIETTMWALSDGRGLNWGPILRGECINPQ